MRFTSHPLLTLLAWLALWGSPALAHPGHHEALPLPNWRTGDGRVLAGYIFKSDANRVWLADGNGQTVIVPLADLDLAGQRAARRTASRLRIINDGAVEEGAELVDVAAPLKDVNAQAPAAALAFQKFERVKIRWDEQFLLVESDGLPDHPMMKGIRAWQQQVPLPQAYSGDNAWRIPLSPVPAKAPLPIKGQFLRGAIALAVNGVPIFNPQNNRGEIAQEIGELDKWGGHCGRADDYHYHATPFHLQAVAGKGLPVAYALDGYPIYGLTEPDGSAPGKLDECSGHTTAIGYHYHGSNKYPYILAAFHGQVTERGGQVDPQPRANPLRPDLPPLRGATVTDYQAIGKDAHELTYEISGQKNFIRYTRNADGGYVFAFENSQGQKQEKTYTPRDMGPAKERGPDRKTFERPTAERAAADRPQVSPKANPAAHVPAGAAKKQTGFILTSSAVTAGGAIPKEFTGDGAGATLPLEWSGAPAGTVSYALVMDHLDPEGNAKWYWILYNIPGDVKVLPKNAKAIGTFGINSVNNRLGYAPPHSKGPGVKHYTLRLYALSAIPVFKIPPEQVDRSALLVAIKDRTLASAELAFTYDRTAVINDGGNNPPQDPRDPNVAREPGADAPPSPPPLRDPAGVVHLIPRNAEEKMNLSAEQRSRLLVLEKEAEARLTRILTAEQMQVLKDSRPPRRPDGG